MWREGEAPKGSWAACWWGKEGSWVTPGNSRNEPRGHTAERTALKSPPKGKGQSLHF